MQSAQQNEVQEEVHIDEKTYSNVTLKFLPKNPTALLQPREAEITASFKYVYRKIVIHNMLNYIYLS